MPLSVLAVHTTHTNVEGNRMDSGTRVCAVDAVHASLRLGIKVEKAFEIYRELGGKISDSDFLVLYEREKEAFHDWQVDRIIQTESLF